MTDSIHQTKEPEIVCPFCKYSETKDYSEMPWAEEEQMECVCSNCGKHFIVYPSYTFNGWISEEDDYYDEDDKD